jgi:hypothetical protein
VSARIRVPVDELAQHANTAGTTVANNLALGVRIVTMRDGRQYEAPLEEVQAALDAEEAAVRRCRGCGCTDDNACLPPCWWVEADLCSACHPGQPTEVVQGRVLCDVAVAMCRCHKDIGHVEDGDEVHACNPKLCTGQWKGTEPDFVPVVFPRAVS